MADIAAVELARPDERSHLYSWPSLTEADQGAAVRIPPGFADKTLIATGTFNGGQLRPRVRRRRRDLRARGRPPRQRHRHHLGRLGPGRLECPVLAHRQRQRRHRARTLTCSLVCALGS